MPLFKRQDREAVGTAALVFAGIALLLSLGAVVVATQADNKASGAPAGAVQVSLSEFAITPASITAPLGRQARRHQLGHDGAQLRDRRHERQDQGHRSPATRRPSTSRA